MDQPATTDRDGAGHSVTPTTPASARRKVVVITADGVGDKMAGPAIRAWNIAQVLGDAHDVTLASTLRASGVGPNFRVADASGTALAALTTGVDVLVLQGFTLRTYPWLARVGARLVIDLYDPIHLELLEGGHEHTPAEQAYMLAGGLEAIRVQIEHGDFFLCATERQRDLWLGHMSALGRVNFASYGQDSTLRKLIDVAPFGIPSTPPPVRPGAIKGVIHGIGPDDQVLLWAGGVYNWFDPITLIRAVAELVDELPRLRLVFMGTQHPSVDDLSTAVLSEAMQLATDLGLSDVAVFFRPGWVPYDLRSTFLTDADIGVSTHLLHVETAYSFRTRMLDYLWAGLPMVCSEGDEFARLVKANGLGAAVPNGDPTALAGQLRRLLMDPAALLAARSAVAELAPSYRWRTVLEPLVNYCADPWPAADGGSAHRPGGRLSALGSRWDTRIVHVKIYSDPAARRRVFTDGRWRVIARRIAGAGVGAVTRPARKIFGG
jgi:glycosyltransferase involved in cell wall biosynthesis